MNNIDTSGLPQVPLYASQDRELWRCVLHALENERCLDLHYRRHSTVLDDDSVIPNYKVMKQLALRERLGFMYRPLLVLVQLLIPALGLAQLGFAAWTCLVRRGRERSIKIHVIATTPNNERLIESALSEKQDRPQYDPDLLRLSQLAAYIRLTGVLQCAAAYFRLMGHIIGSAEKRRDMLLHSRDAVSLLMLAHYAKTNPDLGFVTDDHYQRWSYILSHSSQNFQIVQHGFLDKNIEFEHSFGLVHQLFVRDSSFLPYFTQYYDVLEWKWFPAPILLDSQQYAERAVFLASSFPSIDIEIEFVRILRQRSDVPVIIKFHPSHHYDDRKRVLSSLANHVCSKEQYPACRIFVSYNSFMEYDYRALGIHTVSIARSGDANNAVESILQQLKA